LANPARYGAVIGFRNFRPGTGDFEPVKRKYRPKDALVSKGVDNNSYYSQH
jgi:hypothetical protein